MPPSTAAIGPDQPGTVSEQPMLVVEQQSAVSQYRQSKSNGLGIFIARILANLAFLAFGFWLGTEYTLHRLGPIPPGNVLTSRNVKITQPAPSAKAIPLTGTGRTAPLQQPKVLTANPPDHVKSVTGSILQPARTGIGKPIVSRFGWGDDFDLLYIEAQEFDVAGSIILYKWKLTIKNRSATKIIVDASPFLADKDNKILASSSTYRSTLQPLKTVTLVGEILLEPTLKPKVDSVQANVRKVR